MSVLLHARSFRQEAYGPMLEAVRPRCPELRYTLQLDTDWDALRSAGTAADEAALEKYEAALQFDDPINIQYTSGTTGSPKGVMLTHHNILNNGYFLGRALGYSERDRVCIPVPFYHCFGMVMGNLACTSHGACMVIPGETFQPAAVLRAIQTERCTSLYGVPTMYRALLEDPGFGRGDYSSLRTGVMAGAPCPVELMKEVGAHLHMPEVTIAYGMTETSPVSTLTDRGDSLDRRVSTVGRVFPHVEVCIRDPSTQAVLARSLPGELCTRGYCVMRGYWNDAAATRRAVDEAGWMHTGDLAVMDADGYLHIVGRLKDTIIRGGENISPREVEEVLHAHPDVSMAQVIGVPSRKYGEEVMAWVRLREGTAVSEDDLVLHCREQLATFKVPRHFRFVESFPMTVTGKVQKFRLRELAIELLGLQDVANERTA
jgi:fatty-acyl-CoA synthase